MAIWKWLNVQRRPGHPADDATDAIEPSAYYLKEVFDTGPKGPRLEYLREFLGVGPWKRPAVTIPDEARRWATKFVRRKPLVLLCPHATNKAREWPVPHWIDLYEWLRLERCDVRFVLGAVDDRFARQKPMIGLSMSRLAALMQVADLVIGNDSMPAHLAGTLGTRTVAVLGPTTGHVFAHLPDVTCVSAGEVHCVGCNFRGAFREACRQGCHALYALPVLDVARAVLGEGREEGSRIVSE